MKFRYIFILMMTICLISCGPRVTTTKTSSKNLGNYQTFAYLPNSNFDSNQSRFNNENVGKAVIESVNRNMRQLGYTLDRTNPDLLVLMSTSTDRETNVTTDPVYATYPNYYGRNYAVSPYYEPYYYNNYYGYNRLVGYDTDVNTYKEGTLRLSLVDRGTQNVIWKGTVSDAIYSNQNDSKAIAKFVDDMFAEFPDINK